ncbi:MAG: hypothetical protein ABI047_05090 [Jatrophihabitantaceae bacterium]
MWGFSAITNNSDQILSFDFAVGAQSGITGDQLNSTRGNAMVEIGSLGAIILTDLGNVPGGPYPWCVQVAWNTSSENWWYDGFGVLEFKVGDDGSFAFSGQGQVITGNINEVVLPVSGLDPTSAANSAPGSDAGQ